MYGDMASSINSMALDQQTFGAQVVNQTLDYMNNSSQQSLAPVDQQTFGASVVNKTLDYMNSGGFAAPDGGMSQTYNFSKDVLGAYTGKGSIADVTF